MSLFYYPYPSIAPATDEPVIIEINARIVPLLISSLERYKYHQFWATDVDHREGVQQLCIAQEALLTGATGIVEAIDRLYRLMDTSLNGQEYSAAGEPAEITPAIPLVPANEVGEAPGLRRQLLDLQGELPGGWFGLGARPATLSDLVQAVRAGTPSELDSMLDNIDLLGDAADTAGIFNAVRNTATDLASLTAGGGTLATLVVAVLASAAQAGLAAGQMDTLIARVERLIEQIGVAEAPVPESTVGGELATIRDYLAPFDGGS